MATSGLDATRNMAVGRPRLRRLASPGALDGAFVAVGVLTAIALLARLPHLGESLVGDEMYAFAEVHGRSLTGVIERVREGGENSPPLYFLFAWAAIKLGDPTVLIRLPSLVLGTATVPLVYMLGLRTVGRRGALIAAALMTFSPFAIFYATEARPYATATFLVVLSTLLLLLALDTGQSRWWVLYAITGCAVLYAHYFGAFPLLTQGAWALWTHRERLRELVVVNVAIAVGYVPWLLAFLHQKGNSISILSFYAPLNPRAVGRELLRLFPGHPSFVPSELPGRAWLALAALAIVGALGTGIAQLASKGGTGSLPRPPARLVLIALLAIATPVGFVVYSALGPQLFIARYMSVALPPLVLLVGAVLAFAPRGVSAAATAIVVGCVAYGSLASLETRHRRPPYKDVAHFIDRSARVDDAVVQADLTLGATKSQVIRGGRQLSLDVNFRRHHDVLSVFEENDALRAFAQVARRPRFLLVGPQPLPPPPAGLRARLVRSKTFPGSLPLAVQVYVPVDPARGFVTAGLVRAEAAARARERRAAALARCLTRAGLGAHRADTSPKGSIAVEAQLPAGGRALLYVYSSPGRAKRELPPIARFLEANGGEGKRRGELVVGFTTHPQPAATRRVDGCA